MDKIWIEKALELLKQLIHHIDFVPITILIGSVTGTGIALITGSDFIGMVTSFGFYLICLVRTVEY